MNDEKNNRLSEWGYRWKRLKASANEPQQAADLVIKHLDYASSTGIASGIKPLPYER